MQKDFQHKALRKCEGEGQMTDGGLYSEDFPEHWCLTVDKGYQGAMEFVRAVTPHRRPAREILS